MATKLAATMVASHDGDEEEDVVALIYREIQLRKAADKRKQSSHDVLRPIKELQLGRDCLLTSKQWNIVGVQSAALLRKGIETFQ